MERGNGEGEVGKSKGSRWDVEKGVVCKMRNGEGMGGSGGNESRRGSFEERGKDRLVSEGVKRLRGNGKWKSERGRCRWEGTGGGGREKKKNF